MVRIITDSAADLQPWEYENMGILCIPLTVAFGEREYRENVDLSKDEFYDLLTTSDSFPKTSQASPQILLDLFQDAVQQGDEAIYITLSSQLSGTYQNAVMAQRMIGSEKCFVVDSRNGTGGQRMVVEYAVALRDQGLSASRIVEALETMRDRIELYACLDTLEYLHRGGRISNLSYTVGTIANIKPIITVNRAGNVAVPAKVMGMRKGMAHLCKCARREKPDPRFPFYVMYTNDRAVALALADKLVDAGIDVAPERVIQVGAAIGAHIGPEACGLVYVREDACAD